MFLTNHMGLWVADQGDDPYDYTQLAANALALDNHDHSANKGIPIPSAGILDGAIISSKIAANAVQPTTHLPVASIPESRLAADSVGPSQIQTDAVGAAEIAPRAVGFAELAVGVLDVGTVVLWYRVDTSIGVPAGWEILDGRAWSSVPNAMGPGGTNWTTGNMPDLRARFALGASVSGTGTAPADPPVIGAAGGSNARNFEHQHTLPLHSHSVQAHAHGIGIDGAHRHRFQTDVWDSNGNWIGNAWTDLMQRGTAVPGAQGKRQSLYIPERNRNEAFGENVGAVMETVDGHAHGGATANATTSTDLSPAQSTNLAGNSAQDVRPAYIGLLYIMRVL